MLSTCTFMNASGHRQGSALAHVRQFGMVRPKAQPIETQTICYVIIIDMQLELVEEGRIAIPNS